MCTDVIFPSYKCPLNSWIACSKQEQAAQLIASMVRGLGGISSASMCIIDLLFKNQTLEKQGTKAKQVVEVGLRCLEPGHVKMMYHTCFLGNLQRKLDWAFFRKHIWNWLAIGCA